MLSVTSKENLWSRLPMSLTSICESNTDYNPSNIFARARLVKTRHVTQYAPTKIEEYPSDIPQFK